jgi:hypothetical protein
MKKLVTIAGLAFALALAGRGAHAQNLSLIHFGGDICTTSVWNNQSICKIDGTSVPVNSAADQLLLTTASATGAWKNVPGCLDTVGNHLNYDSSTHTLSCGTSVPSSGGGSGSVTSVNASGSGIFSFTGGPITASGTLALSVAGTSGGIPYFSSSTALASSAALTANALVLGGGAGGTPTVMSSLGTTTTLLHGNASGAGSWSAVSLSADVTGTLAASSLPSNTKVRSFGTTFGDTGGSALTSGSVVYFTVPYTCTISAWNVTVDAGTVTFDIWKIATGTAIPTVTNTITASALPAISTGTALHSTTLTGWTTSVSANDIVGIQLKTVATAKYAELDMECDQ